MATFEQAVEAVLEHEGGYVNDPDDPGGETNFGISKRRYPDVDIKSLTRGGATAIYKRDFWNPLYEKLPTQKMADKLFDASINMTHGDTRPYFETDMQAVRILQQALNDHRSGVTEDGRFGPQTLMAVRMMPADILLRAFRTRLAMHYAALIAADPVRKKYAHSWFWRAVA